MQVNLIKCFQGSNWALIPISPVSKLVTNTRIRDEETPNVDFLLESSKLGGNNFAACGDPSFLNREEKTKSTFKTSKSKDNYLKQV